MNAAQYNVAGAQISAANLNNGTTGTGNIVLATGPQTLTGTLTAATVNVKTLEGVLYADQFAGADIGAKVNAAYAALPAAGGRIIVPSGSYTFSTPIVLSTANKPCVVEGDPAAATQLIYTGTGTAITIDYAATPHLSGVGVRDISLICGVGYVLTSVANASAGSTVYTGTVIGTFSLAVGLTFTVNGFTNAANNGSWACTASSATTITLSNAAGVAETHGAVAVLASTAIALGGSHNVDQALISNCTIQGFNKGVAFLGGSFCSTVFNCAISHCNIGVSCDAQEEGNRVMCSTIFQNVTGITESLGGDIMVWGTSFDDNYTVGASISQGSIDFSQCHFENVAGGTSQYITVTNNGQCKVWGGSMQDDVTTGTQGQFISFGGSYLSVDAPVIQSAGRVITQLVNMTSGNAWIKFVNYTEGSTIPTEYNLSYTAGVVVCQKLRGDQTVALQCNQSTTLSLFSQQGPAAQITGTSADVAVYSFSFPGNWLIFGKGLRITIAYLHSVGTASTTYKLKFGSAVVDTIGGYAPQNQTNVEHVEYLFFNNAGSMTAQSWLRKGMINLSGSGQLSGSDAAGTAAIAMTSTQVISFTFNVANTDKVTPQMFTVEWIQ